jgi:endoglucanase Acf2
MNDHHFHYGYFIYAASILARYDERFLRENRAAVDLLVADIANYRTGEGLPLRRSFDPYFGHSWASGSAPFADGNNQESTSEAINAWVACTLWARLTQDADLELQARWMLSNESTAASSYWLNIDVSQAPFDKKYTHSLISLNWGGKRDYSTFFSPAANAKLGILLIPMNPTMRNVLNYGTSVIKKHVAEATGGNNNVQFGDYILMYDTGLDSTAKLSAAKALPTEYIDGANSRSYLYAWILSQS